MFPELNENGCVPPSVHVLGLEEIEADSHSNLRTGAHWPAARSSRKTPNRICALIPCETTAVTSSKAGMVRRYPPRRRGPCATERKYSPLSTARSVRQVEKRDRHDQVDRQEQRSLQPIRFAVLRRHRHDQHRQRHRDHLERG